MYVYTERAREREEKEKEMAQKPRVLLLPLTCSNLTLEVFPPRSHRHPSHQEV